MVSKKVWVFAVIAIQAFILLFLIKSRIWESIHFMRTSNHTLRLWVSLANGSQTLEDYEQEIHHEVDLDENQYSWLNIAAKNKSSTPTPTLLTTILTTSTLPTENHTVPDGRKILRPIVKHKPGEIYLIVLVTTIPKALDKRELIRHSWADPGVRSRISITTNSSNTTNVVTYVVFMLGLTGDLEQDQAIESEADKYGDILRGSSQETYRNIIFKVWFALEWAQQYQPRYILKVDDDVYVHLHKFVSWLEGGTAPTRLYGGYIHYRAYISRNPQGEHYVSRKEYKQRFFPNYCAGPCYTVSGNLLDQFISLSKTVPRFQVEDAYLGLIAKTAGVKPYDMGGKLFVWDRSLTRSIRKWSDERIANVICLGDSLSPETIKYIHERLMKIRGP